MGTANSSRGQLLRSRLLFLIPGIKKSSYPQHTLQLWHEVLDHWDPWESCIQARTFPTEGGWPNEGLHTSALKLLPTEHVHSWQDGGWQQVLGVYACLSLGQPATKGSWTPRGLWGQLLAARRLQALPPAKPPWWQANHQLAATQFLAGPTEIIHRNACFHSSFFFFNESVCRAKLKYSTNFQFCIKSTTETLHMFVKCF